MTTQDIIDLVNHLNVEAYEQTQHTGLSFQPFEFLSDGYEACITFLGMPWYSSADYAQFDTENSIVDLKKSLYDYFESLKALDLDKLLEYLPKPQPEE